MPAKTSTTVRVKLRNAYLTIAAFAILAATIGIFTFSAVKEAQDEVTKRALPAARTVELLVQQAALVQSLGDSLLFARDELDTQRMMREIGTLYDGMRFELASLGDYVDLNGQTQQFSDNIDEIYEILVTEKGLVDERNDIRQQATALREELLRSSSQFLDILHPAWVRTSTEVLNGAADIRASIHSDSADLTTVGDAFNAFVDQVLLRNNALVGLRHEMALFEDTLETLHLAQSRQDVARANTQMNVSIRTIARVLSEWPNDDLRRDVGRQLRVLASGIRGEGNVVDLQVKYLTIDAELEEKRAALGRLVSELTGEATHLKAEVDKSINAAVTDAEEVIYYGRAGLILTGVLTLIVTVWVISRYILRDVAFRIDALSRATQELSKGNLDVDVPSVGSDELSDIAKALGRFREVAAELRRSNEDLEQFAYIASHDLKAPLRGIGHLAEWIEEDLGPDAEEGVKKHLVLLKQRTNRLSNLLDDLLQFSRAGRQKSLVREVDLKPFFEELFTLVAAERPSALRVLGDMPKITTAVAPMEQVFGNLFGNALKHHDKGHCTVTVNYRRLPDHHQFRVSDDGPGVPSEFQGRVFGMFQTIKPRDELEASGMGLAVIKRVVESVGCSIKLESDPSRGRGTTFTVTWPLVWPTTLTEE